MSKPLIGATATLRKAREKLIEAQQKVSTDRMNPSYLLAVKHCTDEVHKWSGIEEDIMRQRVKINWLRLGDGNNRFFHAYLKSMKKQTEMRKIYKVDGTLLTTQAEIEKEVLDLYSSLMGTADSNLNCINIPAMRVGPQVSNAQRDLLEANVTEEEIFML